MYTKSDKPPKSRIGHWEPVDVVSKHVQLNEYGIAQTNSVKWELVFLSPLSVVEIEVLSIVSTDS